jgi:DNA-binding NtrC family response regulator
MRKVFYFGEGGSSLELTDYLKENRWKIHHAANHDEARNAISNHDFHVGVIHLGHSTTDCLLSLENVILRGDNMEWIIVLPRDLLDSFAFCKFITENFFDYHSLPFDGKRLSNSLGHAYGKAMLKRKASPEKVSFSGSLLGRSKAMQKMYRLIDKIQNVDTPVLICGESGTGKELVAHQIHQNSARSQAPFVTVNCGTLPATLIQSELFGHEKGSFTGAFERKIGQIEAAQGGTVFLDEIGDLPLELQTNLLRFLQEKTIERIGSRQSLNIDAQVIAATNVDLEKAVESGRFREDLYYRLNVLNINLPPLRERKGDIELLAAFFLKKFSKENNRRIKGFTQQALRVMNNHTWPGNVRELINRIQRAVVMSEKHLVSPRDLGLEKRISSRAFLTLDQARQIAETEVVRNSLISNGNNVSQAAKQLGVSRVTLYRLMDKLQLEFTNTCH